MQAGSRTVAGQHLGLLASGSLRSPGVGSRSSKSARNKQAVVRVSSRFAGSGGNPPPPQQQQQYRAPPGPAGIPPQQQQPQQFRQPGLQQPPAQRQAQPQYQPPPGAAPQQPLAGRAPVPASRRVGVSPRLQQQGQQQGQQLGGGSLQRLAPLPAAALPAQQPAVAAPEAVRALAGMQPPAEVTLARSQLMDKEVITRTSANRLGYVNQLFVDPGSLAVVSVYLRKSASSLGSVGEKSADQDHMLLDSLQQVSDVVLVHDETALEAFPLDDTMGYCRLVGAEVVTEAGVSLGRVRDFLFNPDTGAISTIKYDKLGVPSLPQQLLSCYSISWEDVRALGPTRLVVYSGTEQRAIKENDGIADVGVSLLLDLFLGPEKEGGKDGAALAGGGGAPAAARGMGDDAQYRTDQAYYEWYAKYGAEYQQMYGIKLDPPAGWVDPALAQQRQQAAAPPPARRAPPALPPPQAPTFAQAVQAQQAQQGQPSYQQQLFQQQRQAVPAGGGAGWGAPPPAQQQRYAAPPAGQQPPPGGAPFQPQQPFAPQQPQQMQFSQQAQQARGPPPPQQAQQAQQAQQYWQPPPQGPPQRAQQAPLPPQNGIPIIDRTPLPPYRRRDADGNYGAPPPQAGPTAAFQQSPPAAQQAQRAAPGQPQAQQAQQAQQPPVVVPDAVIPGGSAGSSGGATQVAEYRQL